MEDILQINSEGTKREKKSLENKKYLYFCRGFSNSYKMMKRFATLLAAVACVYAVQAEKPASKVTFDASKGVAGSVTMPNGQVVHYTAYTDLYYVAHVEDSTYQRMNIFVPEGADERSPIFLRNYVGGYMAAKTRGVDAGDASGRALAEGYVVAIPGARGRNSFVTDEQGTRHYNGRAPMGLLDLKAAVRYLRHFDREIPGNAERIISDGTSAGGALSSLLGATGNHPFYEAQLKAMGACDERNDIFAAVCYCPIIDLDHADMAYEWLYACTNNVTRPLDEAQLAASVELAAAYPAYLASLNLQKPDGSPLTADNCRDYIKQLLIQSAQEAKDAGADIPDSLGFAYNQGSWFSRRGEYIVDLDLEKYLNYVVTIIRLKTPAAFDSQGVAGGRPSGENEEFGDESGRAVNYTDFSLRKTTGQPDASIDSALKQRVYLLNPLNFIADPKGHQSSSRVHPPRRPRPRHLLPRTHQPCPQAAELRHGRGLQAPLEPSPRRRLRPQRIVRLG